MIYDALRAEILRGEDQLRAWRLSLIDLADDPQTGHQIVQHPDWIDFEIESRNGAAQPYVIAVVRGTELLGYVPLLRQAGVLSVPLGRLRIPVRRGAYLRMLGAGLVARPADAAAVLYMAAEALRADKTSHVVFIQETEVPNPFAEALRMGDSAFRKIESNLAQQVIWSILPHESASAYLAGLGSKRRKALQSRARGVRRAIGGEVCVKTFQSADQLPDYCSLINQVYGRSWHSASAPIDWESIPLLSLFSKLARKQRLLGYVLTTNEKPVAYVHGYCFGGVYEIDNIGFDESYRRLGIGSMLVFEAVQDFFERYPNGAVSFGYGDNVYKQALSNHCVPAGSLYLVRSSAARFIAAAFAVLRRARSLGLSVRKRMERLRSIG